jgi:5-methylcytosine-specific restriction endonuclease McrA
MIARLCNGCGHTFPAQDLKRGRCSNCRRQRERQRGSAFLRGYDKTHQRLRALAIRQHPFCVDCGTTTDLTADHIVPKSRGGLNVLSNYAVRCRRYNSSKHNRMTVKRSHSPSNWRQHAREASAAFLSSPTGDPPPGFRERNSASEVNKRKKEPVHRNPGRSA